MTFGIFDNLIIVLSTAVAVVVLCLRVKIPPILGYLLIGVLVGPHAIGLITDVEVARDLAEFGVVFLMFTIGLEFSLSKMIKLKNLVFGLGSIQVIATTIITTFLGTLLGMSLEQATIVGCIVAMSSTAIVSKQLADQNQLGTVSGQSAISILLFQDLAVIPFFIFIASFANEPTSLQTPILVALGKTLIALAIIFVVGRWLLRPLFREISRTESLELFTLVVLLVTLGAAYLTARLDLSLALGAFVAGMMLGETEFRHQIEATIRPFRDVLLGLFFITIGTLFNVGMFTEVWAWILLLFTALTLGKVILIGVICFVGSRDLVRALRTGLILAQGGEFGFALLNLALSEKLLPGDYGQVVLGALLLSMLVAPILVRFNQEIARALVPKKWSQKKPAAVKEIDTMAKQLTEHVILCGFSRVGQQLAKLLDDEDIPYIAIDFDHQLVLNTQAAGFPVIYGDASLYEILTTCKIRKAKALVVTFEQAQVTPKIIQQVRNHHKKIPVFVRTHDDSELEKLQALGATEVIPATLETSLTLASHLLVTLNVPTERVAKLMNKIRKTRYRLLREVIPGEDNLEPFV